MDSFNLANLNNPVYSSKPAVYADPNQMYDTPASPEQQQGKRVHTIMDYFKMQFRRKNTLIDSTFWHV